MLDLFNHMMVLPNFQILVGILSSSMLNMLERPRFAVWIVLRDLLAAAAAAWSRHWAEAMAPASDDL